MSGGLESGLVVTTGLDGSAVQRRDEQHGDGVRDAGGRSQRARREIDAMNSRGAGEKRGSDAVVLDVVGDGLDSELGSVIWGSRARW